MIYANTSGDPCEQLNASWSGQARLYASGGYSCVYTATAQGAYYQGTASLTITYSNGKPSDPRTKCASDTVPLTGSCESAKLSLSGISGNFSGTVIGNSIALQGVTVQLNKASRLANRRDVRCHRVTYNY